MAQPQIESTWLCLEPPFFLAAALKCSGLDEKGISPKSFADDEIAAKVNVALRSSIELHAFEKDTSR